MHAMALNKTGSPLQWTQMPDRAPEAGTLEDAAVLVLDATLSLLDKGPRHDK
ncbi:hypothetical protein SAMN04490179_4559 [Pseudomonas antarctica]|uniref:Uncharacterized protein n=1 Tax=Pseudomonas antarctica TaxID=219572 RepID=A0A1H0BYX1_9PSED|nr:hypothetical protein PSAN_48990 [Pseudomonas antarctica]SDN50829.1 hypothetical protein SAMN04490179_4559 [Pseudomonas antarctica]